MRRKQSISTASVRPWPFAIEKPFVWRSGTASGRKTAPSSGPETASPPANSSDSDVEWAIGFVRPIPNRSGVVR
jgi:hypothetical protein